MPEPKGGYLSADEFNNLKRAILSASPESAFLAEALSPRCTYEQVQEISSNTGLWYKQGQFYDPGPSETDAEYIAAIARNGYPVEHPDAPIFRPGGA